MSNPYKQRIWRVCNEWAIVQNHKNSGLIILLAVNNIRKFLKIISTSGILLSYPVIISVFYSLYNLQTEALNSEISLLESMLEESKQFRYDNALNMLKSQKEIYESDILILKSKINELEKSSVEIRDLKIEIEDLNKRKEILEIGIEKQYELSSIYEALYELDLTEKEKQEYRLKYFLTSNELAKKDLELSRKDLEIAEKDRSLAEKDRSLAEKDLAMAEKDLSIEKEDLDFANKYVRYFNRLGKIYSKIDKSIATASTICISPIMRKKKFEENSKFADFHNEVITLPFPMEKLQDFNSIAMLSYLIASMDACLFFSSKTDDENLFEYIKYYNESINKISKNEEK